ncbi:MAG: TonB-dependent receptor [Ferruginibacter sp.]
MKNILVIAGLLFFHGNLFAQLATIKGTVTSADGKPAEEAVVALKSTKHFTEVPDNGTFTLTRIPYGSYTIIVLALGKQTIEKQIVIDKPSTAIDFVLNESTAKELDAITVMNQQEKSLGITRLRSVRNFTVYEGKKNEVVLLNNIAANTSTNNARQIYGGITGLNIWESDGGGLQLGIGGRGLSPNRTSNFNTRQDGYDISADALGYPESYYTPPTEALERIEVIRGAASLQYGTQFGGTVNFLFKSPEKNTSFLYTGRQTVGSWNFINSFNSFSGTSKNKKLGYYAFYQRKQGDGWRPNSDYKVNTAFVHLEYNIHPRTTAAIEYTHMDYLAKQPGGLTRVQFDEDPRQSFRTRNWFKINWNLFALNITHKFSPSTQLNARAFGLIAKRQSLGLLEPANITDLNKTRDLIDGQFKNWGTEVRLLHRYKMGSHNNILLAGIRTYVGHTTSKQDEKNDSLSGPDFTFKYSNALEGKGSDYKYPNRNFSVFAEHIFNITDKLSITPGSRFENIQTFSEGYYRELIRDYRGEIVSDITNHENLDRKRNFIITGIGVSYKLNPSIEWYGNFSQNYRAINFSDLRIQNSNFKIDSAIADEKGYSADLGIRGNKGNILSYEITAFYLYYNNRIGQVLMKDQPPLFKDYRYRTNVSASRNIGIESFAALNIARLLHGFSPKTDWTVFVNATVLSARYIKSKDKTINDKEVEMVPPVILRSGTTFKQEKWKAGFQLNYTARHFSDATNAVETASAIEGEIPAYMVADLSASYQLQKWLTAEFSCNNLFNEMYFTRRAESYPGPGIIPSDGRSFFVTLQFNLPVKNTK